MSEKKGIFGGLFGGKKSGGCCNMEIVEESQAACDCGGACGAPVGNGKADEKEEKQPEE